MANLEALNKPPPHYPGPPPAPTQPAPSLSMMQKHAFHVSWAAPNGMTFEGDFVCRIPTMRDQFLMEDKRLAIGAQCKMRDGDQLSAAILNVFVILSVVLEKTPEWWPADPTEVVFPDLLALVSEEVTGFIDRFHQPKASDSSGESTAP